VLDKVVKDLQEGGKGPLPGDPRLEVGIAVNEPAEDVEDQDAVLHGPAKVAKGVRHALHLAAEIANREVTLDKGAEARIETRQARRASGELRTRSWRSREIVLSIQESTTLLRRSHEGSEPSMRRRRGRGCRRRSGRG